MFECQSVERCMESKEMKTHKLALIDRAAESPPEDFVNNLIIKTLFRVPFIHRLFAQGKKRRKKLNWIDCVNNRFLFLGISAAQKWANSAPESAHLECVIYVIVRMCSYPFEQQRPEKKSHLFKFWKGFHYGRTLVSEIFRLLTLLSWQTNTKDRKFSFLRNKGAQCEQKAAREESTEEKGVNLTH